MSWKKHKKWKHQEPRPPPLEPFTWDLLCLPEELEYFEERAAIMEHDGGCTERRAEELAQTEMLQKFWGPRKRNAGTQ